MTTHQAEANLKLTDKGWIRVLENRVKDLEAALQRSNQFIGKIKAIQDDCELDEVGWDCATYEMFYEEGSAT